MMGVAIVVPYMEIIAVLVLNLFVKLVQQILHSDYLTAIVKIVP